MRVPFYADFGYSFQKLEEYLFNLLCSLYNSYRSDSHLNLTVLLTFSHHFLGFSFGGTVV
jgi:hypothetical protein